MDLTDKGRGIPDDWLTLLSRLPGSLTQTQREHLERTLFRLPAVPRSLRSLLDRVYQQAKETFDDRPVTIAVVGPVNSGKSTLVNALTGTHRAEVSPAPGTTRAAQWVPMGPFSVADTPGMNEVGGEARMEAAKAAARLADVVVVVFDASAGVSMEGKAIWDSIQGLNKPALAVLNKADLVRGHEAQVESAARQALGDSVLLISAQSGANMGELMKALVLLDTRVLNSLTDLLPEYRHEIARHRVAAAAALAAAIGWEPIPIADAIPLGAIQAMLVLDIARIYGEKLTLVRARELSATFAGGLALREGYRQVAKLIPFAGGLLSSGIAAAGTAGIGAAAIAWFESGGSIADSTLRVRYQQAYSEARRLIQALRSRGDIEPALKASLGSEKPGQGASASSLVDASSALSGM